MTATGAISGRPPLTIGGLRVHLVDLPVRSVRKHGIGSFSRALNVIVELRSEGGLVGWGEACPWPAFTGTAEAAAAAVDVHFRPHLVGADGFGTAGLMARLDKVAVGATEAKAAVETALLDLKAKALGVPLYDLLGGARRERIPLSVSLADSELANDLALAEACVADGIRIFKVKTGFAEHRFDIERLEGLRKRFGMTVDLRIDYNQGLHPSDALSKVRDMEAFQPSFIEQPVPGPQREALAAIARAVDTPIMADESVFSPEEAVRAAAGGIADLFSIKLQKAGGFTRALEIAAIARAAGIGLYGGSMFEAGVANLAGTHMMAVLPEARYGCEYYTSSRYLTADILTEPFVAKEGHVVVTAAPGLGIEVDPERLAHHSLETRG